MAYLSISEMAKQNNLSVQTLRFYDKIGIFKPEYVNPDNQYRYYSVKQICDLDIIKYLRHAGTPLEEIRHVVQLSPEDMCGFLDKQAAQIDEQIRKLSDSKKLLAHHRSQIGEQKRLLSREYGNIYTRYVEERTVLRASCRQPITSLDQHKLSFRGLAFALEHEGSIMAPLCGSVYPLQSYESTEHIQYEYLFTALSKLDMNRLPSDIDMDIIPAGMYICIAFQWSTTDYYEHFNTLKEACDSAGLEHGCKVYEISMPNQYASSGEGDFITELQVYIGE